MNSFRFEVEIIRGEHALHANVPQRQYDHVQVTAEWPLDLATPELRLGVEVRGDVDHRDAPSYVELFIHDVFLLLNLADPPSFGGTFTITGGELAARELTLSDRLFEYAKVSGRLTLAEVTAWYDGLQLGTRQQATSNEAIALFELLHLARNSEDEESSIVRLARAAEALLGTPPSLRRLFDLRDQIARGRALLFHPMHDETLDPSIEDATAEWIEVADAAAQAVISELQKRARSCVNAAG
jgi:hypothetical protein